MTTYISMEHLQDILSFPFRDPQWKRKLGIAALLYLAIYTIILAPVHFFIMGYFYRIMKHIIVDKGEPYLPEWDNWGKLFIDGLRLTIPGMFFSLPGLLLLFLSQGGMILSMLPIMLSGMDHSFVDPVEPILPLVPLFGLLFFILFFGLGIILSLALTFLGSPAICHVVATDQVIGAFRINEWWPIFHANFSGFVLAQLVLYSITTIMTFATQFLSMTIILIIFIPLIWACVGLMIAMTYYVLLAQAYATGRKSQHL
ncbi:MAG: DUF4013 domain-containing protein [Anaerolineales bacterium]|nr:DUF4013 domain-containing protein [Anaerolineales bacterium]